jgi:hypothetical protein
MLRLLCRLARLWLSRGDAERLGWRFADGVVSRWLWWWCRSGCETLSALGSLREARTRSSLEAPGLRRRVRSLLKLLSRERRSACLADGYVSVVCVRLEVSLAARGTGDDVLGSWMRSRGRSRSLLLSLSLIVGSSGLHWSISWVRRNPAM